MNYLDKYTIPELQNYALSEARALLAAAEGEIKSSMTAVIVFVLLPTIVFGKYLGPLMPSIAPSYYTMLYILLILTVQLVVAGPTRTYLIRKKIQKQLSNPALHTI